MLKSSINLYMTLIEYMDLGTKLINKNINLRMRLIKI